MKVESRNENPVVLNHYVCNVCGCDSIWTKDHMHIERSVGKGYSGYEVYFITCSDECRDKCREVFIAWLSSYGGWSENSASENYDLYVLPSRNKTMS